MLHSDFGMDHLHHKPRPQSELLKPQGKYLCHHESDECYSDDAQLSTDGQTLKKTCSAPAHILSQRNESQVWNHAWNAVLAQMKLTTEDGKYVSEKNESCVKDVNTEPRQERALEVYAVEHSISEPGSTVSLESGDLCRNNKSSSSGKFESLLRPMRKRIFYSREWVFEKLLKHIRPSIQETVLNACLNLEELDTVTEAGTVVSDSVYRPSSGTHNQRVRKIVIVGGPGSGKTTICRRIVDARSQVQHLTHTGLPIQSMPLCAQLARQILSAHFCYQQIKTTLSPSIFVLSMHKQILSAPPPLCELYSHVIRANEDEVGHHLSEASIYASPDSAFRYGILSALQKITPLLLGDKSGFGDPSNSEQGLSRRAKPTHFSGNRFVVLIDGIDELDADKMSEVSDWRTRNPQTNVNEVNNSCDSRSKSILDLLVNNAQFFPDWICLLFTCRRQNRNVISRLFPGIKRITIDDLHRSAVSHDVHQYLLSRLAVEQELQYAFRAHMHSDVLGLLRIKSSACLLYLETLLDAIGEVWISPEQLASIPGTLNGLFLWICQHLFQANGHSESSSSFNAVRPILDVLLASPQTLTVEELFRILSTAFPSLNYSEFQKQLSLLRRILVTLSHEEEQFSFFVPSNQRLSTDLCPSTSKKIHFFHPSFVEWLLDVKHCTTAFICSPLNGQDILRRASHGRSQTIQSRLLETQVETKSAEQQYASQHETYEYRFPLPKEELNTIQFNLKESETKRMESSAYYYTNCTTDSLQTDVQTQPPPIMAHHQDLAKKESLVLAARLGEHEKLCSLLDAGEDANQLDEDGWSALRTAAWRGHVDIVDLLLDRGARVDLTGPDGRSALRAAAWAGHEEIVQRLLDARANVDIQDAEGRTPLIAAAYMGHVGVVEILAQAGANLNHADEDGRTALHVASFCVRPSETHQEVVSCLLEFGANPNIFDNEGLTPLLGAARIGNHAVCELCLEADTDVNQMDKYGNTAISLAVLGGHTTVVRLLLFWGAAVDMMDNAGRSLLSIAASTGNASIVQELLARGLDEAHRDHTGCTPLHLAAAGTAAAPVVNGRENAQLRDYCEVIRLLVESGAQMTDTDNAGKTPFLVACETGQIEAVKVLIQLSSVVLDSECHSLDQSNTVSVPSIPSEPQMLHRSRGSISMSTLVSQPSLDGQTPLRVAAMMNNPDLVSLLLSAGADPDYQDAYGRTTLYVLALEGMVEMADLLLHTPAPGAHNRPGVIAVVGANPVLADDEGRCPLHVATWQGHVQMVRLLLQAGTPVDIRDREGRTPLQLAAWQGHAAICQVLLSEGNARVDAVCSQGATSLCIAAQEGHLEVCTVLLQAGANPFQADSHGRTPYRVALKACHFEICEMLERNYGMGSSNWFPPGGSRSDSIDPTMTSLRDNGQAQHALRSIQTVSEQSGVPDSPTRQAANLVPEERPRIKPGLYMDDINPYAKPPGPLITARQFHQPPRTSELVQQQFNQSQLFYDRVQGQHHNHSARANSVEPAPPVNQMIPAFDGHQVSLWTTGPWQSDNEHGFPRDSRSQSVHPMEHLQPNAIMNCLQQNYGQYGPVRMQPIGANHTPSTTSCTLLDENIRDVRTKPNKTDHQYKMEKQVVIPPFDARAYSGHPNKQPTAEPRLVQMHTGKPTSAHFGSGNPTPPQFYPDLISHPVHQRTQPEHASHQLIRVPQGHGTSNNVLRSQSIQSDAIGPTRDPQTVHPPPLPEHNVVSPTKRKEKPTQLTERNRVATGELNRAQPGERSPQPNFQSSSGVAQSPTETKPASSSTKSTFAGMFGLGSRKNKKASKKSLLSNTPVTTDVTTHNMPLLEANSPKPRNAHPVQRNNSESSRTDFPSDNSHANIPRTHGLPNQNTVFSTGQAPTSNELRPFFTLTNQEAEKASTGSMQLESLARKLACCSQIEGVPKSDEDSSARATKGMKVQTKQFSPQTWLTQSNRRKEHSYPT